MRTLCALLTTLAVAVAGAQSDTVYKPGNGVSVPRVTREVKPDYTKEAKENRIEGTVMMDVVVQADGAVGDVKVVRSLDSEYGLDDNAVKAMRQWQFVAGRKDDKPVPVAISVEMTFALK
jgi:TonB family protein